MGQMLKLTHTKNSHDYGRARGDSNPTPAEYNKPYRFDRLIWRKFTIRVVKQAVRAEKFCFLKYYATSKCRELLNMSARATIFKHFQQNWNGATHGRFTDRFFLHYTHTPSVSATWLKHYCVESRIDHWPSLTSPPAHRADLEHHYTYVPETKGICH
jgi:hypothetical protein